MMELYPFYDVLCRRYYLLACALIVRREHRNWGGKKFPIILKLLVLM
jgi:hypothetical protein